VRGRRYPIRTENSAPNGIRRKSYLIGSSDRDAAMQRYRLYVMDKRGKVIGAGNFQCRNDETARACIKQIVGNDHETELWRLVGGSDPDIKTSSAAPDHQTLPMNRKYLHS